MSLEKPLPSSWASCPLEAVAQVIQGQSPPGSSYNGDGNGLPFFQGKAEFGERYPVPVKWCTESKRVAQRADVLISIRAPVGPTNLADQQCCIGRGLAAIRPSGGMPSEYFLYYLRHTVSLLTDVATGSTFDAIGGTQLRNHRVSLPPLPEQHRIVAALESYLNRLDDAVASLERVQRNLKRYRASVLKAAVEGCLVPTEADLARQEGRSYEPASVLLDRILAERRTRWIEDAAEKARAKAEDKARKAGKSWTTEDDARTLELERAKAAKKYKEPDPPDTDGLPDLPEGWCWGRVAQLGMIGTGATPKRGEPRFWASGVVPWVTSAVVNTPLVTEASDFVTESALRETNLSLYEPGTLLVAMYGEGKTRGRCTELGISTTTNQALAAIVLRGGATGVKKWVRLFMDFNYQNLRGAASGGVQPNLNLKMIGAICIPIPPHAEQQRISVEVDRLGALSSTSERMTEWQTRRIHRLRQSILKWAFEGKLVDQDPNDEPASVLLERIEAERRGAVQ